MASSLKDNVIHWKKKLERNTDEQVILNVIHKLSKVPMTYEILQETGVGKVIKIYAKKKGTIGDKAKCVLMKWRAVVNQKTHILSKYAEDKKHVKKSSSDEEKSRIHRISEIESYVTDEFISENSEKLCQKQVYRENASPSNLYTYEKSEGSTKYIDYDPHCNVNLGYSPEHPELYPGSHKSTKIGSSKSNEKTFNGCDLSKKNYKVGAEQSDTMRECISPKTIDAVDHQSDSTSSHIKDEINQVFSTFLKDSRREKKASTSAGQSSIKHSEHQSKKRPHSKNSPHHTECHKSTKIEGSSPKSSSDQKLNGLKKHKSETDQPDLQEYNSVSKKIKSNDHQPNIASVSSHSKCSLDQGLAMKNERKTTDSVAVTISKHSKQKSKSGSSDPKIEKLKLSKEAKNSTSSKVSSKSISKGEKTKVKLKIKVREEFTASEASFEDCLKLNDLVCVKKKKNSSKSSVKKEEKVDKVKKEKKNTKLKNDYHECSPVGFTHHQPGSPEYKDISLTDHLPLQHLAPLPKLTEVDILSTLPQTQPNYIPLPQRTSDYSLNKKKVLTNEDAIRFTSSRREKTAVYSGRRNVTYTEVPTLYNVCIQVLIENIDAIEFMGGTPYFLIKPVMERCTPAQLSNIEHYNPYLLDDTQELWEIHCKRDYRTQVREDNETWRDLYMRAHDEREKRLKTLTANISASMSKSNPVRRAKLAYVDAVVKPPRDVARRQAKHGTALPVNHTMKAGPPSKASPRPTAPVINSTISTSTAPATTSVAPGLKKPKVAPLMAKTLKSLKQCFRR